MASCWRDDFSPPVDLKVLLPCRVRCDHMALPPCDCPMLPWASWSVEVSSCFLFERSRPEGRRPSGACCSASPSARGLQDSAALLAPLSMRLRRGSVDYSKLWSSSPTRPDSPDPLPASKPRAASGWCLLPRRVASAAWLAPMIYVWPSRQFALRTSSREPRHRSVGRSLHSPTSSASCPVHRERCAWLSHRCWPAASVHCPVEARERAANLTPYCLGAGHLNHASLVDSSAAEHRCSLPHEPTPEPSRSPLSGSRARSRS